jgi:hypothetical protein
MASVRFGFCEIYRVVFELASMASRRVSVCSATPSRKLVESLVNFVCVDSPITYNTSCITKETETDFNLSTNVFEASCFEFSTAHGDNSEGDQHEGSNFTDYLRINGEKNILERKLGDSKRICAQANSEQ